MNKALLSFLLLICSESVFSQQFNLYNSRTLYDVFENPSQSAYQIDTSRKVAFNFFIPTLTINATASGSTNSAIKTLIYEQVVKGSDIIIGEHKTNIIAFNTNTYIAMLRLLHTVKKSQEIGLSWQIKNDGRIKGTNETLAIFDDYSLFDNGSLTDVFNDKAFNQSYHQFSLIYRQDVNKRLSLGAKGSLLSGLTYNSFKVNQSKLNINQSNGTFDVSLAGDFRSSFDIDSKFSRRVFLPNFKNPGLSVTAGASYKLRNGFFLMGNLKDIGFIKWNKTFYTYDFNIAVPIANASNPDADERLKDELENQIKSSNQTGSYITPTNGKIELLLNKNYGKYQPNLILSKSIFYDNADIVLTNNYHYRNLVLTASADYNTSKYLAIGGQFMIKSPNTEFFMGSDHLLKSIEMIRDARNGTGPYSAGYTGLSFYMGFGIKLGRILEHPANANFIPGINDPPVIKVLKGISKKKDHL